ncbi:hypothetical protein Moror_17385 [Moniliophthora roreri MCA 2997]|uniref:Uncharacterized protein n=2 Tax=Moniliophthora roreri TaxID=221103 RepID=V2XET3_MONRO|nr:hypothetical protein Moror_17385 [Moniliophthora roreri MCA 2997]
MTDTVVPKELKTLFLNLYVPPLDGEPLTPIRTSTYCSRSWPDSTSITDSGYAEVELCQFDFKTSYNLLQNASDLNWRDYFNLNNPSPNSQTLPGITPYDIEELIQELVWYAVSSRKEGARLQSESESAEAEVEATNETRNRFERVKSFVLTGSHAFITRFVQYAVGLFWKARFIESKHPLFASRSLREYHLEYSIKLAEFLASFYMHGSGHLTHAQFRECICAIMDHLFFYEGVRVLRCMVDALGRSKSIFWTAEGKESGKKGMMMEAEKSKWFFAHKFKDSVTLARLPLGRKWGMYGDGMKCLGKEYVRARVVNREIRDMFVRLGVDPDKIW